MHVPEPLSPTCRSRSRTCQALTGATTSSINRSRTHHRWASVWPQESSEEPRAPPAQKAEDPGSAWVFSS